MFSWLFSKNTEKNSYVRRWLLYLESDPDSGKGDDSFNLSLHVIQAASRFGKHGLDEQDSTFQELAKDYFGDATIFEIVCYTYYRMTTEQALPTKIADAISGWIVEVFSIAWKQEENQVSQLVNERLEAYRSLAAEEQEKVLVQKLLNTKGDKISSLDLAHSAETDISFIEHNLKVYKETQIPLVLEATQQYRTKQTEELSAAQKLSLPDQKNDEEKDYSFAMALLEQKDLVKACRAFTKVISTNPKNYDALLQRGQIYFLMGNPIDAMQDFDKAIAVSPKNALAYLHRGKCHLKAFRQPDEAIADYSTAIKLAPQNALGYLGRGEVFDEIAAEIEKKALENDKAAYAKDSKPFLSAIQDYNKAINLNPDFDEAFVNRGLAHARRAIANGNTDHITMAIADMEKAMALNWENGYLHKKLDEIKELQHISLTE